MSEDALLGRLRARLGPSSLIGDDAAVLPLPGEVAVTVDSQVSGVHFLPGLDAAQVARRLLAVNLSDLAAMGGVAAEPSHAFLALSAPPDFDHDRFFDAFTEACRAWNVTLAGGDLARCDRVVATLTLIGTRPEGGRWLRRTDAKPGHDLWLGGTVGESAAGRMLIARGADENHPAVRRHLLPVPQLELGRWLGQQDEGAAMDVSDGVAIDLHRLCRESGVGAVIDADALPLADGFFDLCGALSADPYELALAGGEDYVLLFTLPAGVRPPGCSKIGSVLRGKKIEWIRGGRRTKLPASGWDHLTSPQKR